MLAGGWHYRYYNLSFVKMRLDKPLQKQSVIWSVITKIISIGKKFLDLCL